jgi:two-component system, chemotaxis family, protein-glutamate methylesterase/glutaminase
MPKKKVLLVDDSAIMRPAVRPLFDSHARFVVCGEAEHGREAIEKAPSLRPDLIVIDMSMPVMNGLEAAPHLITILPNVLLILLRDAQSGLSVLRREVAAWRSKAG